MPTLELSERGIGIKGHTFRFPIISFVPPVVPHSELIHRVSQTREMAYTPGFKQLIQENPGALQTARDLFQQLGINGPRIESNGVSLEYVFGSHSYLRLSIGERHFFVKRRGIQAFRTAPDEIMDTEEARARLANQRISWAEVVNYQLGFRDGSSNYFVSDWDDRLTHPMYVVPNDAKRKVRRLKEILADYKDVGPQNMSYDQRSGKIILFDLGKTGH